VLLRAAPHIIWPLRFVLPHSREQRPAWMTGSDCCCTTISGVESCCRNRGGLDLSHDLAGKAIKPEFRTGFEYSDCWVDDARLVVLNALDAAARNARNSRERRWSPPVAENGAWRAELRDQAGVIAVCQHVVS